MKQLWDFNNLDFEIWLLFLYLTAKPAVMTIDPNVQLTFKLVSVVEQDPRTRQFVAWFDGISSALGIGNTEKEAELNLLDIFQVMLKEKKHEVISEIITNVIAKPQEEIIADFIPA